MGFPNNLSFEREDQMYKAGGGGGGGGGRTKWDQIKLILQVEMA